MTPLPKTPYNDKALAAVETPQVLLVIRLPKEEVSISNQVKSKFPNFHNTRKMANSPIRFTNLF